MSVRIVENYAEGRWVKGTDLKPVASAITGETIAQTGSKGLDYAAMLRFGRTHGGSALRRLTIHERARMVKALAAAIMARKEELYELAFHTGGTRADNWIDIEGGAGTMFSISGKARRELPDTHMIVDGDLEELSRKGTFSGLHVYTPKQGVALQINAYNFPVWGMLEKLAPSLIAGLPTIVKPAQQTGFVTELAVRIMLEADVLPEGALQLISGSVGDLFEHLGGQDSVAFTGSAGTATMLQQHPVIAREAVQFTAERDSLNGSILGPDAAPGTPEFDIFIKEVAKEMTAKAGQKCTAIRRAIVPADYIDAAEQALAERLAGVTVGDPRLDTVRMGALVSTSQRDDVLEKVAELGKHARIACGDPANDHDFTGDDIGGGAFLRPILLRADDPWTADAVHDVEAFGPVSTLMPYTDVDDAVALANRGMGSLALSIVTHDNDAARQLVMGTAAFHGRTVLLNRDNIKESTGHGSPLAVLVHGGPGRAGGGEELGGTRAIKHAMQRSALQGTPDMLAAVTGSYLPGATQIRSDRHPFRKTVSELQIGETFISGYREVTLEDIEHFAHFTGDTFYAHMDEEAARANPIFGGRVAHGYLLLSFAAGLFVDPAPGPVLANYGLEGLRFIQPVKPGDRIKVSLTAKAKKLRTEDMGEVRWAVRITNEAEELVASYELLTMNEP